jgi:hypothetical protein
MRALGLLLLFLTAALPAQKRPADELSRLTPKQRELYATIRPARPYASLSMSEKSTFEAVTNALERSTLTGEDGRKHGNVLGLITKIEKIAGEAKGEGGDKQFRLYAEVRPEAHDLLVDAKEFFRDKDNTVYHRDYPINFRQRGKVPTIQVSMALNKDRVDIDVDYRSSRLPQSAVNGHLSSSNSDVRAGSNYARHTLRWQGLVAWWRGLFAGVPLEPPAFLSVAATSDSKDEALTYAFDRVEDASEEFFHDWLVRRKPAHAMALLSEKVAACVNVDDSEERELLKPKAARVVFRQVLDQGVAKLPNAKTLQLALRPVKTWSPQHRGVPHNHSSAFEIIEVDEEDAEQFVCTKKPSARTKAASKYVGAFQTPFHLAIPGGSGMTLLWRNEGAAGWKIVSFDVLAH